MNRNTNLARCDDAAPTFDSRRDWKICRARVISTAKDFNIPFASVLQEAAKHYKSIAIDEDILGGTPRITGTRIPVYMILDAIDYYGNLDGALKSYPHLSMDQVKEVVSFAGAVLEHPVDF